MSEFADQLDTRIDDVRHRIHEARSAGDDFLVENLIDDLQNLMELAGRNDLDTGPIAEVIQAETGDGVEVALDLVPARTEPGVEPAVARYVVDAEAQGRGRGAHPLIPPCSSPRMKYRCIATKRAMIGISAMMVPAAISRGSS